MLGLHNMTNARGVRPWAALLAAACAVSLTAGSPGAPAPSVPAVAGTVLALSDCVLAGSGGQPGANPRPAVIALKGDFDCMKLVRELRAALDGCAQQGCTVALIEISGNRWRSDVTLELAEAIREARVPPPSPVADRGKSADTPRALRVFVYLVDESDHEVGGGQAALALVADGGVMEAGTRVLARAETELKDLCPGAAACDKAKETLRALITSRAGEREIGGGKGVDVWSELFPTPVKPAWLAGADPWKGSGTGQPLRTSKPRDDALFKAELVCGPEKASAESLTLTLDAVQAMSAGLTQARATSTSTALAALGVRGTSTRRLEVSADLKGSRERLGVLVTDLDQQLRSTEQSLRDAGRSRSAETLSRRRRAGQDGLKQIAKHEQRLAESEQVLTDYPEILQDLPPGQTPVAQAGRHDALWRTLLQDWRDRLAEARARAQALADARE